MWKKCFLWIACCTLLISCNPKPSTNQAAEQPVPSTPKKVTYYAPYCGLETTNDLSAKRPFLVMLDNHPHARPQAGISQADIIYEMKAEGEYTRYLALFQSKEPNPIGPIRSTRPYFVDAALEYDPIFVHWGGSEAGYQEIRNTKINHIDGIAWEGSTFYRNKEVKKKRPHNGYTTFELLRKRCEERKYPLEGPTFQKNYDQTQDCTKLTAQMKSRQCTVATLKYFPSYTVEMQYAPDSNCYFVLRNGEFVTDENNRENVTPKNIIIQLASSKVAGPKETLAMETLGSGKGYFLSMGKIIPITWEKQDKASPTKFRTEDGQDVILHPGLTWIAVLNPTDPISFSPTEEEVKAANQTSSPSHSNESALKK